MERFQRVAIIAKPVGNNIAEHVRSLIEIVRDAGCTPLLDDNAAAHLKQLGLRPAWRVGQARDLAADCDVAISLGGDGTMLGAARTVAPFNVPVIGINAGRLGFITDIVIEEMARIIPDMLGSYVGLSGEERKYINQALWMLAGATLHH